MRSVVIVDGTVAPGMEVGHGPGRVGRRCAYEGCGRGLGWDAPPNKRFCASKCRTADWKARQAEEEAILRDIERIVLGDAENGRSEAESKRAAELRELRKAGPVASDRRVQVSRAVESVAALLIRLGQSPDQARFYARVAVNDALPARFKP